MTSNNFPTVVVDASRSSDGIVPALHHTHSDDAGLDLRCAENDIMIFPHDHVLVETGWKVTIPANHVGLVCPRSGLAAEKGVTVLNAPGIIDPGYSGQVKVILHNPTEETVTISTGSRIAQLVVVPCIKPVHFEVTDAVPKQDSLLAEVPRGAKGFGSTGR